MTTPVPVCEIAFSTNPAASPTWTDVSAYLQSFSFNRGRQTERDVIQTGSATILLDNIDRRFDPTYTAGPYYPNVIPMRRIRISATYNGVTTRLFSGYVQSWPPTYPGPLDSNVQLRAADGFLVFAMAKLNTSFSQQQSDARINAVLDALNWGSGQAWVLDSSSYSLLDTTTILGPTGDRLIGAGNSAVQAVTLTNVSALQHMQDVMTTENGLLYMNGEGSVVFIGRRPLGGEFITLGIFGDNSDELHYVDIALDYSDVQLWNEVIVTRAGGTAQTASDSTSQTKYFKRTLNKDATLMTSDSEAFDAANWLLYRYKDPGLRITSMLLDGEGADPPGTSLKESVYSKMLGVDIGGRVLVRRRPPGGGTLIEQSSVVQAIATSWVADGNSWATSWTLSPADSNLYWMLGDASFNEFSILDTTTRLAY